MNKDDWKCCNGCPSFTEVNADGFCKYCAEPVIVAEPLKQKSKSSKKSPDGKTKPQFFAEIWRERKGKHYCVDGGKWLGETAHHFMFSHDIDVSIDKTKQWDKNNISLRCFRHHHLKDHGTKEQYEQSLIDKECSCQPYFKMVHEYKR